MSILSDPLTKMHYKNCIVFLTMPVTKWHFLLSCGFIFHLMLQVLLSRNTPSSSPNFTQCSLRIAQRIAYIISYVFGKQQPGLIQRPQVKESGKPFFVFPQDVLIVQSRE